MLRIFGRFRQLHTIISKETVKPSSPTPPHLKTHNLSITDRDMSNYYLPWVFFYTNYDKCHTDNLKSSLSQCLTQYYPFAGRLARWEGHIDCNDQGIEFLEACIDSRLDEFVHKKEQDEMINQLIPNGLGCIVGKSSPNLVEVQLNHFKGGGVALGVSISHKVADGFTKAHFINQWATIKRGESPMTYPKFISSATRHNGFVDMTEENKYVKRVFVFPNSKLSELTKTVIAMGGIAPANPTRVEVLTSLIYKSQVDAATTISGSLNPTNLVHIVNMRNKIVNNNFKNACGNVITSVIITTKNPSKIRLNQVVSKLRKEKNALNKGLRDLEEVKENYYKRDLKLGRYITAERYLSSSLCGFPLYEADFGWGKPVEVTVAGGNTHDKSFVLMDTPNKDGIVAIVQLPKEEMLIFQKDKQLLTYANNLS